MILNIISTEKQQPTQTFVESSENDMTKTKIRPLTMAFGLMLLGGLQGHAQTGRDITRFSINGSPILSEPTGEFRHNISNGVGANFGFLYHIDRPGFLGLRFDISALEYDHETRHVPFSEFVGGRILLDERTSNSIISFSFGPELAWPRGKVRPYVNGGVSELLFRTTSSVSSDSSDETIASTTNFKDSAGAWFLGGGVRLPLAGNNPRKAVSLDLGVRYHWGGEASYLREGSITDHPDGTISIFPLTSRTPHMVYMVGIRFRFPHDPATSCPRLVC
jgi:hypothetical protein